MNHSFLASQLDRSKCNACGRGYMEHTTAATCDACGTIASCDIYGNDMSNPRALLLCQDCTEKEDAITRSNDVIIEKTKLTVNVDEALKVDQGIRYSGDFFNAQTMAMVDVEQSIIADASISNKIEAMHSYAMSHIKTLREAIFEKDKEKLELVSKLHATIEFIRNKGNLIRKEERDRLIAESNLNFTIHHPIVTPKVPKQKLTALERMVQAFVALNPGTHPDDARKIIREGMIAKGVNPDA